LNPRSRGGGFKAKDRQQRPRYSFDNDHDYDYEYDYNARDPPQTQYDYQDRGGQRVSKTSYGQGAGNDGGFGQQDHRQKWPAQSQAQNNGTRPVIPAQVTAQQKGIQPQKNPTGNPFQKFVKVPASMEALKKLQIKQNLSKVGDAPRVISQKIKDANNSETYIIEHNWRSRTLISERFAKIQDAQRALHPLTIQLLNEKRGIFGAAARATAPTQADQGASNGQAH
jgi:hypothetical protein